ncbi:MAG TPA: DUF3788 domain-containing protein [Bryobacteraceae bacterium]|jgi:hypothetical protein
MPLNAFIGKAEAPTEQDLALELGESKPLWDRLLSELAQEQKLVTREWNSYSRKAGWSLRLKREKRNILYLSPEHGSFTASFALGDKAIAAARQSKLPERVIRIINEAKRYAEGTGVRIEVKASSDIAVVRKLTAVKLAN